MTGRQPRRPIVPLAGGEWYFSPSEIQPASDLAGSAWEHVAIRQVPLQLANAKNTVIYELRCKSIGYG
jgi:hypothetical protein